MSVRNAITRGLLPVARAYYRFRPGIRILMYHRVRDTTRYDQLSVSPQRFDEQMASLATHSRVISLEAAVREIAEGVASPAVAVTFDDGYLDNLTQALPILRRHGIPATVFVTVAFCDQRLRHPRYGDDSERLHLDWTEVGELSRDPLICIGSHTMTHPFLSRLDAARAAWEIAESRVQLQSRLNQPINNFCYPSGDVGPREMRLVGDVGYQAAVSVRPGQNRTGISLLELQRTEVTDRDRAFDLAAKLDGAYDLPHMLLHWRRMRGFRVASRREPLSPSSEVST